MRAVRLFPDRADSRAGDAKAGDGAGLISAGSFAREGLPAQ
jgi:hypothetical protein